MSDNPNSTIFDDNQYKNECVIITPEHNNILPEDHPAKGENDWLFHPNDPYHPDHSIDLRTYLSIRDHLTKNANRINEIKENRNGFRFDFEYLTLIRLNAAIGREMIDMLRKIPRLSTQLNELDRLSKEWKSEEELGHFDDIEPIHKNMKGVDMNNPHYHDNKSPQLPPCGRPNKRLKIVQFEPKK